MTVYNLTTVQKLPISLDEAWGFFSNHRNLKEITPPHMGFNITSANESEKMYEGMIITYKLYPVLGIPVQWMTEITHIKDKQYFIDEQRSGPYAIWHHQHWFKEIEGGVEMTDMVDYKIPLGILGNLAHVLFVRKQLKNIFDFRYKKLEELFGKI